MYFQNISDQNNECFCTEMIYKYFIQRFFPNYLEILTELHKYVVYNDEKF